MARAAVALALRGHQVLWSGGDPPAAGAEPLPGCLTRAPRGVDLARAHADIVVGGGDAPLAAAGAGWLARAHALVLDFAGDEPGRWGPLDRLAWATLFGAGLTDGAGARRLEIDPGPLALERIGLWSDDPPACEPDAAHPDSEMLERACERALARHRGGAPRPALFVDRDGTLVVERGYLSDPRSIELLPGVAQALQNVRAAGHPVVVISNQSGVGRGMFTLGRVHEAMAMLRCQLRAHGVELDAVYFCPHRPEDACACRKPGIALLERAAEDLVLDLGSSAVVGDKLLDVRTGHGAGALGILVRTGYGRDEEERAVTPGEGVTPEFVADGLGAAVDWLLAREGLGSA
jgi:histidinol-phosphate phosphatase family protein